MRSTKISPARKQAALPSAADYAKSFVKDWQRLSRAGRHDMRRLKDVMMLLIANDEPMGAEWRDHALYGQWADHRECHVGVTFY